MRIAAWLSHPLPRGRQEVICSPMQPWSRSTEKGQKPRAATSQCRHQPAPHRGQEWGVVGPPGTCPIEASSWWEDDENLLSRVSQLTQRACGGIGQSGPVVAAHRARTDGRGPGPPRGSLRLEIKRAKGSFFRLLLGALRTPRLSCSPSRDQTAVAVETRGLWARAFI